MKIIIGSDHAGFEYKQKLIFLMKEKGIDFVDCGCYDSESVDYPDYAHDVSAQVITDKKNLGVLICCLLYTSPSPRDQRGSRMPSSA